MDINDPDKSFTVNEPKVIGGVEKGGSAGSGLDLKSGKQLPSKSKGKFPKNDSRHWLASIIKPVNGRGEESPHYSMRTAFKGTRMSFSLGTGNKEAAARKARDIYGDLLSIGVDATLIKHRTHKPEVLGKVATVGDWIAAAEKVFDGRPATFGSYARCLRLIAASILGLAKTKKRFGKGNTEVYREKIDAAPLGLFTPEAVQAWRIRFVQGVGDNATKQRSARTSCNSALRQARSLFSRKFLKFMSGIPLPEPLPFAESEFYPRESMRYQSKIDPSDLLQKAQKDIEELGDEAFKALILALGAGLRRGELDRLLWRQINFRERLIHIEVTEAGGLKSKESACDVSIDSKLAEILLGFHAKAKSPFVIEGGKIGASSRSWGQRYRCGEAIKRVMAWLRKNGVNSMKPLHTLRKEAGAIVATKSGIYAASHFLRHAGIQVTSQHYADQKERVTIDITGLLAPKKKTSGGQAGTASA